MYTVATVRPRAFPRSWGGYTELRIATDVPNIIALPTPCMILKAMSRAAVGARAHSTDADVKTHIPNRNIFFLPWMSASLPNGTRNTAAARRYEVTTQLKDTAVIENSSAIDGNATLMDDAMNGVRNELSMATRKAEGRSECESCGSRGMPMCGSRPHSALLIFTDDRISEGREGYIPRTTVALAG